MFRAALTSAWSEHPQLLQWKYSFPFFSSVEPLTSTCTPCIESIIQHSHQEFLKKKKEDVSSEYDGITFSFTEASIDGTKVLVSINSDKGNETDVYVVRDVPQYINDTQYAGAISPERVKTEVWESVAPYGIEEDELEVIIKGVKEVLEGRGVRFFESL